MAVLKDLAGRTFGRLEILSRAERRRTQSGKLLTYWTCKCVCGTIKEVGACQLLNGHTVSCGCYQKECVSAITYRGPFTALYALLLRSAKHSKRDVTLTYEDLIEFTKIRNCHYCNIDIPWNTTKRKGTAFGYYLDRVDNNTGYTKENCVVCCTRCNMAKKNLFTYDEWLEHGELIRKRRESKENK
jgi:hypothetical protein